MRPSTTSFVAEAEQRDDRILVGALDLSQQELASRIVLVTHDRNMQSKARRLGLQYVDSDEL